MLRDLLCFGVGTFTAIPVPAPRSMSRRVTLPGLVLAPVMVLPLGLAVTGILYAARELGLAPLAGAAAAIGALALGTRAFHLDGLADTADALTSGYDRERALAIMKRGDTGPAGVVALVLVLLVQVGAAASLLTHGWGPVAVGVLVCVSRGAAPVFAMRGIPAARSTGLAASYAGALPAVVIVLLWLALAGAVTGTVLLVDLPWWRGPVAVAAALLVVAWLGVCAVRRFGGVAGDQYGAAVELSLAALLLAVS